MIPAGRENRFPTTHRVWQGESRPSRGGSGRGEKRGRKRPVRRPVRTKQMGPTRRSTPLSPARGLPEGSAWRPVSEPMASDRSRLLSALSPVLAPASGSVWRSVRIRRSFPVPPGGSETGFPLAFRLERLRRSGRSLRHASSASDRTNRPMVARFAFPSNDRPCFGPKPSAWRSQGPRGQLPPSRSGEENFELSGC